VQDVYAAEMGEVPEELRPHWQYLGRKDIPRERYLSKAWHDLEVERVWGRTWQMACRESDIPNVGDQTIYDVADRSVLLVRVSADVVQAYWNACMHRGTMLREKAGCAAEIRCPYHGWTWGLDGRLKGLPSAWDLSHMDRDRLSLPQLQVACWGGFVFVNPDTDAEPFESYAGPIIEHWKRWPLENRSKAIHVRNKLPCNWKVAMDAFIEGYHAAHTHPQAVGAASEANVQYDIWDGHVSRMLLLIGIPSPDCPETLSEQEVLDLNLASAGIDVPIEVPDGLTARQVLATTMHEFARHQFGDEVSSTDSPIDSVDVIVYYLFPNLAIWAGSFGNIVYRFLPVGDDPEQCTMEIIRLFPTPAGDQPTSCPIHDIGLDGNFLDAPELGPFLAPVAYQDEEILPRVQRGMRTTVKPGISLTDYQESLIRNQHRLLDHYILHDGRSHNVPRDADEHRGKSGTVIS
jgi:phenylpropionate dioxygenase-like ring-hydroxylating dioxygenase large terminal subunit